MKKTVFLKGKYKMSKFTIKILETIFVIGLYSTILFNYLSNKLIVISNKIGWKYGFIKGMVGVKTSQNAFCNWTEKFTKDMV